MQVEMHLYVRPACKRYSVDGYMLHLATVWLLSEQLGLVLQFWYITKAVLVFVVAKPGSEAISKAAGAGV